MKLHWEETGTLYNLSHQSRFIRLRWGDRTDLRKLEAENIRHKSTTKDFKAPSVSVVKSSWWCHLLLSPQQTPEGWVHVHDIFPINTDSVVNALSTNCRKEFKTPREVLVCVTDGGYAVSNSQAAAKSVTNNFISVQAKLSFIMLPAQNMPLAETFLKGTHLRETVMLSWAPCSSPSPVFIPSVTTIYTQNSQVLL